MLYRRSLQADIESRDISPFSWSEATLSGRCPEQDIVAPAVLD